ncbi:MAG: sugar phosphate isomerase/epimerase [Firmicutes bacterium]|nr:sugar phosphate isomerase/epimerase [Bacillota bacterium]
MELGLYHTCFLDWPIDRLFSWMQAHNFRVAELHGGPKYRHISWPEVADGRDREVRLLAERHGIEICDIMYGPLNFLSPEAHVRREAQNYAMMLLRAASRLGVPSVSVFTGRDPALSLEQNLVALPDALAPVLDVAERVGVKLALENCPMAHEWPWVYNVAVSPALWREIFRRLPTPYLGLTLDPSHLVWQGIDYISAVKEFAGRIVLAQAKDTEVMPEILRDEGIFLHHFWRHRIPGQGQVDWKRYIAALVEAGYHGPLVLEHEDPFYQGTDQAVETGVLLSQQYLSPYLSLDLGWRSREPRDAGATRT